MALLHFHQMDPQHTGPLAGVSARIVQGMYQSKLARRQARQQSHASVCFEAGAALLVLLAARV